MTSTGGGVGGGGVLGGSERAVGRQWKAVEGQWEAGVHIGADVDREAPQCGQSELIAIGDTVTWETPP